LGVKAPGGSFIYPEGLAKAAFLTGGIGITPFRSILRDQADRGPHPDRVFLYFNRNPQEIPFRDELEAMSAADPTFRLVHVLEEPPPGWGGWIGRISREILEKELPDLASRTVFVCGPPPMIAAAERLLSGLSFPPDRLRKESFAGYGS
jgi:ferredoxin-NADP reductase